MTISVHGPLAGTTSRLRLEDDLTFENWLGIGRRLSRITNASPWWLGDWLIYGHRSYGERYKAALDVTDLDYQTLRNYAWVARRFPVSRRRDALSFQHHAEVASLSEPEQDLWLGRAATLGWSRNQLRRELASLRACGTIADAGPVQLRIRVDADRERVWRVAAETVGV